MSKKGSAVAGRRALAKQQKTVLPLLKAADFGGMGIRKKMFRAALSTSALEFILSGEK
jgi:hypothetical protein